MQTVIQTIQLGVPVARIELLDALSLTAINRYSKTTLRRGADAVLRIPRHARPASRSRRETVQDIAGEHGGMDFEWATRPEDRSRLWQARHDAYFACLQLKPGCRCFPTDVCVPISRLAECIAATNEDIAQVHHSDRRCSAMSATAISTWSCWSTATTRRTWPKRAWISERVVERAIAMEGTCTGEHGIGLGKRKYLVPEHGAVAVDVMRTLKTALDPAQHAQSGQDIAGTLTPGQTPSHKGTRRHHPRRRVDETVPTRRLNRRRQ